MNDTALRFSTAPGSLAQSRDAFTEFSARRKPRHLDATAELGANEVVI